MAADLFFAVADPTRRRLLDLLRGGGLSVGELVAQVVIAQAGVSRHLRILEDAGFVTARADRQRRIYSLNSEPFDRLDAWTRRYKDALESRLDRFANVVKEKPSKVKP